MSRFALAVFGSFFLTSAGCGSTTPATGGGGGGGTSSCAVVCYNECCSDGQTCNLSTHHCEAAGAGGGAGQGGGTATGGSSTGGSSTGGSSTGGSNASGGGTSSGGGTHGAGGGSCVPQCSGAQCGSDGCGGTCGTCPGTQTCFNQQCCAPQCAGAMCGDDSCGGTCGTCSSGTCTNGQCTSSCPAAQQCGTACCSASQTCTNNVCGTPCPAAQQCGTACCGLGQMCSSMVCVYPPGTVTASSHGNKLPPTWSVTSAPVLKSDDTGTGAAAHINQRVTLSVATHSSTMPCPLPHTSSTGKLYCDGFNAIDSSMNTVVIDTFDWIGSMPSCTLPPADGTSYTAITGVWTDDYDSTAHTDTFVIAPTSCSDFGSSGSSTGSTPPSSTDIANLAANFPDGMMVSNIHGVVIAVYTSTTGGFGFAMEDPGGGNNSAILVTKAKTSTSTSTAPAIGDYVSVTGTARKQGPVSLSIKI